MPSVRKEFHLNPGYFVEMVWSDMKNESRLKRINEAKSEGSYVCSLCMGTKTFRDGLCKICYFNKEFRSGKKRTA